MTAHTSKHLSGSYSSTWASNKFALSKYWHLWFYHLPLLILVQESLAATYGAGISNACVVDMGAVKTSIACVDDGLVIADTR